MRADNTKFVAPYAHLNILRTAQNRINRNNCNTFTVAYSFTAKNFR